jgi:4-hydroxybenzoate polyprenyltransferase
MARQPASLAVSGAPQSREVRDRSPAGHLLVSLRPSHWTKNLVVFAGLIFGRELFEWTSVVRSGLAFVVFCALSSAIYLLNDIADREADGKHPLKAMRPIAAGAVPVRTAAAAAGLLSGLALIVAFGLGVGFGAVAIVYCLLQLAYSHGLKHVVILDVLTIATGFVLRAVAGAVVIGVPISNWLLVCTILLALFLALSKRRHELVLLADGAMDHRRILQEYNPYLLDQMIAVVTASTLMAYAFYTISPETVARFGTNQLGLTIGFPLYGIFRYLYLVHRREGGGSPADTLLTDPPLLVCVALWAAAVVLILYRPFAI